jgi:hypothetical protein
VVAIAPEQHFGIGNEARRPDAAAFQHAGEEIVGEQPDILREHAEHEAVDEVRDALRLVPPLAQALG